MRTAEDIVRDYRARGYSDERLRALANGRPEPIRSQILELLAAGEPVAAAEAESGSAAEIEDVLAQVEPEPVPADAPPEIENAGDGAGAGAGDHPVAVGVEEDVSDGVETAAVEPIVEMEDGGVELLEVEEEEEYAPATVAGESVEAVEGSGEAPAEHGREPETATERAEQPSLAEIVVERMTAEEYFRRHPEAAASQVVTAGSGPEGELEAKETAGTAPAPIAAAEQGQEGEKAPAAAGEEVPELLEQVDSGLLAVLEPESPEALAILKQNRAAIRSLQVLQEALQENPDLLRDEGESNVIDLDPPYALVDREEDREALEKFAEEVESRQEVSAGKEKSGLIKFPSEMVAAYEAIARSQQGDVPAVAASGAKAEGERKTTAGEADVERRAEPIAEEIAILRNWLNELEDALKLKKIENEELMRLLSERDETLRVQAEELQRLREEMHADEARVSEVYDAAQKLQEARAELAAVRKEMESLEREYNILATDTVPALKQDKEDLVELLEEEMAKQRPLREALRAGGRRLAVSYTLAAAASLLMVLSLVFQWVQGDAELSRRETMLAALRRDLAREKERTSALDEQARLLEAKWTKRCEELRQQKARLVMDLARKDQIIARKERQLELATLRGGSGEPARTRRDVMRDNRNLADAAGVADGRSRATYGGEPAHRNRVRGIEEWQRRHARRSATTAGVRTKTGRVRRGEGISHVLWRELGTSNPALVEWVARRNGLKKSGSQGYWIVHPGDVLVLPADPAAVADAGRPRGRAAGD